MHFRSFNDLHACITANASKIPFNADLIIGVPRSGLLAANILALHLNVALTDVEGFLEGRVFSGGKRIRTSIKPFEEYKNIVVLDDSILTGNAMNEVRAVIKQHGTDKNIVYGAVFAAPDSVHEIDFYFNVCPMPRMFEWNLMHHKHLERCCFDLDGVLCKDPTEEENDDGERYKEFLSNAIPLLKPTHKLGCIVTNRLEKYRALTEDWLEKNNISYNHLIMSKFPSKEARVKAGMHAEFKAHAYLKTNAILFIESSEWQSNQIAKITRKPVYCVDMRKMIYP
jgi:uncharacterized HAD superfamily protein